MGMEIMEPLRIDEEALQAEFLGSALLKKEGDPIQDFVSEFLDSFTQSLDPENELLQETEIAAETRKLRDAVKNFIPPRNTIEQLKKKIAAGRQFNESYKTAIKGLNLHKAGIIDLGFSGEDIEAATSSLVYLVKFGTFQLGVQGSHSPVQLGAWLQDDLDSLPLWFRQEVFAYRETTVDAGAIDPVIRLVENPDYKKLDKTGLYPGRMSLENHDPIHILCMRAQKNNDEAIVIGLSMGSTGRMNARRIAAYLYTAQNFYNNFGENFSSEDGVAFLFGASLAKNSSLLLDFTKVDFSKLKHVPVTKIKEAVGYPQAASFVNDKGLDLFRESIGFESIRGQIKGDSKNIEDLVQCFLEASKEGSIAEDEARDLFEKLSNSEFQLIGVRADGSEKILSDKDLWDLQDGAKQFSNKVSAEIDEALSGMPRGVFSGVNPRSSEFRSTGARPGDAL